MNVPLEGGCRCDAVRFRLTEAPIMTAACHCPGCKRMSSSAFSLTALCLVSGFAVTKGQPVIGGLRGADLEHYCCGGCMTWMFTRPSALPDIVNVRPTLLDDHGWFAPFIETYVRTKLPWATTGAARSFEEFPPMETWDRLRQDYVAWEQQRLVEGQPIMAAPPLARAVRALLAVEWGGEVTGKPACPACAGYRRDPGWPALVGHEECPLDAALTEAGLADQAARDAARACAP